MNRAWLVSLFFIALTGPMSRADAGPDMKQMEGTWQPQSAELAAEAVPAENPRHDEAGPER